MEVVLVEVEVVEVVLAEEAWVYSAGDLVDSAAQAAPAAELPRRTCIPRVLAVQNPRRRRPRRRPKEKTMRALSKPSPQSPRPHEKVDSTAAFGSFDTPGDQGRQFTPHLIKPSLVCFIVHRQ